MSFLADNEISFSKEKKQFNNEKHNNKYKLSTNIDSDILQQLDAIFQNSRSLQDKQQEFDELRFKAEFRKFIEDKRNYPDQIIQLWNYYSNTNDHGKHTEATLKLSKIIQTCNRYEEFNDEGIRLIRDSLLLPLNIKVFYRGLSSLKPPTTNPILRLLNNIILFNKGEFVDEFVQLFNLDLSALSKLLAPTKIEISADARLTRRSIRYNAMCFFLSLVEYSSPMTRNDILTDNSSRRKLITNMFKYSSKFDACEIIDRMLNVFEKCILKDPFFNSKKSKSFKLKIFNQWNLVSLLQLYYLSDNDINLKIDDFFREFFWGEYSNVLIVNTIPWLNYSITDLDFTQNNNHCIRVGSKNFYTHNQFAYHVLIEMKPWENKLQLMFVLDLLLHVHDLIPIYTSYLSSINGNFDPKLTFYWIGQAVLLQKIIKLSIPESIYHLDSTYSPNNLLILESILPNCINSVSLTKCLKSSNLLIVQLSLQILCVVFEKFEKITELYEQNEWNNDLLKFTSNFQSLIPDITMILSAFADMSKLSQDNKLLILSLIKVLNYYVSNVSGIHIPSNGFLILSKYFNKLISSKDELKGIDLLLLDGFFRLQEFLGKDSVGESHFTISQKWYSFSQDNNSLFCNLLKLNCFIDTGESLDNKVVSLLNLLVSQSSIYHSFEDLSSNILIHQNIILGNSLKATFKLVNDKDAFTAIWNLLDQTISRSTTPYKYIDLSNEKYENISPFFVILFEQFKFVPKDDVKKYQVTFLWLILFSKYAVIIGEPKSGIISLMRDYIFVESTIEPVLGFIETSSNFKVAFDNLINNEFDSLVQVKLCERVFNEQLFFFENISYRQINNFEKIEEAIVTDFDLIGCLNCIVQLIHASKLQSAKTLMNKVDNYLTFTNADSALKVLKKFLFKSPCEAADRVILYFGWLIKSQYYTKTSNELQRLLQLFSLFVYSEIVNCLENKANLEFRQDVTENIWALNNKCINALLISYADNLYLTSCLLYHVILTSSFIDGSCVISLVKLLIETNSEEKYYGDVLALLAKCLYHQIIDSEYIPELCLLLAEDKSDLVLLLLDILFKSNNEFAKFYIRKSIAANEITSKMLIYVKKDLIFSLKKDLSFEYEKAFSIRAAELMKSLSDNAILPHDYSNFLKCINYCFDYLEASDKEKIQSYFLSDDLNYDIFTEAMLEFILKLNDFERFGTYINKCFLFLNKKFAETENLSTSLENFITILGEKVLSHKDKEHKSFLHFVSKNFISTQFEIIMKSRFWVENMFVLNYLLKLVDSIGESNQSQLIDFSKFLQMFLSNDKNPIHKYNEERRRFAATILVYKMFNFDVLKNSTHSLRERILLCYNGSISASDLFLFDILNKIEEKLPHSWLNGYQVCWEFVDVTGNATKKQDGIDDYDDILINDRLIEKEKATNSLTVTLKSKYLRNSINNFPETNFSVEDIHAEFGADIFSFYETMDLKSNRNLLVYDPRFISFLIINIDDLMILERNAEELNMNHLTNPTINFDLRKLIDSELLEYLIVCLSTSDEKLLEVIQTILYNVYITASNENTLFPEKELIKVLIQKILTTFSIVNESVQGHVLYKPRDIPPLVYKFIAKFVPIITNPKSHLYERAYKYLLGMPGLSRTDLPLFKQMTSAAVEVGTYYKDIIWLLSNLIASINSTKDIIFFYKRKILDWLLSLKSCPYFNYRIKSLIYSLLSKIQDIDNGSYTLITKFGMLPTLQMEKEKLISQLNVKLDYNVAKNTAIAQELADLKENEIKTVLLTNANKRLCEWTNENSNEMVKKLCN